ncbi:ABC transporter substrate-binding protein [Rodentibacter caecimuris]|uniref:Iron ABC transporter substrate-binding protein n=1 Tax=Rodentibacter caecimuris TaxID=1796644 RepID=A0ABX3KVX4_9PAST|nr:hypothetical protein BKG89_09955 [Rodentibacter heylii]
MFHHHYKKRFKIAKTALKTTALLAILPLFFSLDVQATGKLSVYCTVQNTVCEKVTQAFSKKYQVNTQFVRHSTGTVLGKIKAEKNNPQADIWFGGTIEPHLQAAELGLFESYRSPRQKEIMPQFKKLTDQWGEFTSIIYLMELGIGVNTEKLKERHLAAPQCFSDLIKPEYKDLIQYPDPRVSGTGYSFLTTMIQLLGEKQAFDYFKKLNANIAQHSKTGMATNRLATGDVGIDISFLHAYVREKDNGAPIEGILPCEKTAYTLGGASIIKGARNLDNAKLFMDYLLSVEAQEIPWREYEAYQRPTNIHAKASPKSGDLNTEKLLEIDFGHFGSDKESKRLIEKWVDISK